MSEKKEKTKKKIDKASIAVKIVAGILAIIFIASIFTTVIYYIFG